MTTGELTSEQVAPYAALIREALLSIGGDAGNDANDFVELVDLGLVTVTATQETLENWTDAASGWSEASQCHSGLDWAAWRVVQIRKGQPRRSYAVIDCGDFRAVI